RLDAGRHPLDPGPDPLRLGDGDGQGELEADPPGQRLEADGPEVDGEGGDKADEADDPAGGLAAGADRFVGQVGRRPEQGAGPENAERAGGRGPGRWGGGGGHGASGGGGEGSGKEYGNTAPPFSREAKPIAQRPALGCASRLNGGHFPFSPRTSASSSRGSPH